MSQDLLIACIYTSGSPYAAEARELAESAARFGYRVEAIEVADQGDWWRNVGIKPSVILEAFRSHHGPLLSLDADCRILRPLDEMLALLDDADVAVKYRPTYCFSALFNAAVLLLKKTPATLSLVETWAERGKRYAYLHRFAEQSSFAEGILFNQQELRFCDLPGKFHVDPRESNERPSADSVIFHRKTSRSVRQSELPKGQPPTIDSVSPPQALFVSLRPHKGPRVPGLLMWGADAACFDFKEYASRYGIRDFAASMVPMSEKKPGELNHYKTTVLGELHKRLPADTHVVLSDFDVVYLRDPRIFCDPLESADLVIAWDAEENGALPLVNVIGMRLGPAVADRLLPAVQGEYQRLCTEHEPEQALRRAFATVLSAAPAGVRVATVPAASIGDLATAGPETTALAARGEMRLTKGEKPCLTPKLHPHRQTKTAAAG